MVQQRDIVVIGAGLGGMSAIGHLARTWPRSLQVAVLVAYDALGQPSGAVLEVLQSYAPFQLRYARDGEEIRPGRIYLGPPEQHMAVHAPGNIGLEPATLLDKARPSVDRLFVSAADVYGPRVIAVVLTGGSRDGLRGTIHVEELGGIVIVQDPQEAVESRMPSNVLRRNDPDYCASVGRMARLIETLVQGRQPKLEARAPP